jgi:hypothetical protein
MMYNYWILIRNSGGYPMKVTIQAPNPFVAIQQARALYGSALISEGANAY